MGSYPRRHSGGGLRDKVGQAMGGTIRGGGMAWRERIWDEGAEMHPPLSRELKSHANRGRGKKIRTLILSAFGGSTAGSCLVIALHVLQKAGHDADGGAKDVQELRS